MATTITLIDFKLHQSSPNSEYDDQISSSSSLATTHNNENVNNLFQFMKNSLSTKPPKTFSLNFEKVGELKLPDNIYAYDLVFSDQFDKVILGTTESLSVFERSATFPLPHHPIYTTITAPFLTVRFDNVSLFHCLKLVVEQGEEFIYATTSNSLMKINVRNLMQNNGSSVVWVCEEDISNIWGVDIIGDRVFALDFDKSYIKTFDKMTGKPGENQEVPTLDRGYGIHTFTENEIVISSHHALKIFSKEKDTWTLVREQIINDDCAIYSIFYEKHSDLIYFSHTNENVVVVVRRGDFSIVKSFDECATNYGLAVDGKTGFLYVCNVSDNKIYIFK